MRGVRDRARDALAQLVRDQLQSGGVRHQASCGLRLRVRSRAAAATFGCGQLLGALGLVALAPAQVGVALDLALELEDAVDQRLGPGRAAGHVDVDRQELVGAGTSA